MYVDKFLTLIITCKVSTEVEIYLELEHGLKRKMMPYIIIIYLFFKLNIKTEHPPVKLIYIIYS